MSTGRQFVCFSFSHSPHLFFLAAHFPVDELQRSATQSKKLWLRIDRAGIEAAQICWNLLTESSRMGLDWAGMLLLLAGARAVVWWAWMIDAI